MENSSMICRGAAALRVLGQLYVYEFFRSASGGLPPKMYIDEIIIIIIIIGARDPLAAEPHRENLVNQLRAVDSFIIRISFSFSKLKIYIPARESIGQMITTRVFNTCTSYNNNSNASILLRSRD